ncbi:MAG: LIC12162 family protein [Elusimicrobiota bacterium]
MHLAVTPAVEFWDTNDELLFIGPWCARYDRRSDWEGMRRSFARDPWLNEGRVHAGRLESERLFAEIFPPLVHTINRLHSVNMPERYWRILTGPWLIRYIHFVLDRHERLKAAFEDHPELKTTQLDHRDYATARDTLEFQTLGFTDAYNLQIASQLMSLCSRNFPTRRLPDDLRPELPLPAIGRKRRLADWAVRKAGPPVLLTELFADRKDQWRLLASLTGRGAQFVGRLPPPPPASDWAARDELADIEASEGISRALVALLPQNFPSLYLEGFAAARERIRRGWRRRPKVLVSAEGWVFNEALKFAGAEFYRSGTTLIGAQHGGGYGVDLDLPTEWMEKSTCDLYVTWGWTDDEGSAPNRPLPNPRLFRLRGMGRKHDRREGSALLFVTDGFPLYPFQFYGFPIGREIERDFEDQFAFIAPLKESVGQDLTVRPYPVERGWRAKDRLLDRFPGLRLDEARRPLHESFPRTRLLAFNCLGTAFLEALAYGMPCLVYLAPRFAKVRPQAEADLARLREAGILMDSPVEAARRAAELHRDPFSWWDSAVVRRARELWCERYAGGFQPWLDHWTRLLREAAGGASPP